MSTMELHLKRDHFSGESSLGRLSVDGIFECFTLEPPLAPKQNVNHASAIPDGRYKVSRYASPRAGFDVLLLHNVPGYDFVEVHPGNFSHDSKGCVLPGLQRGKDVVFTSRIAFGQLTDKVFPALEAGEVWITVETLPTYPMEPE